MPIRGVSEAQLFGEKEVEEKMGVKPKQIVDYKGLVGDSSDNYPGVPGIGPKTAVELLKKFGSLEGIYKSIKKIENKTVKDRLKEGRKSAKLSKKLATVIRKVPIEIDWERFQLKDLRSEEVINVLKDFGFKSLVSRLSGGEPKRDKKQEGIEQERLF